MNPLAPIPRKLKSPKFWVTCRARFWAFARRVQFFASELIKGSSFQWVFNLGPQRARVFGSPRPRSAEGFDFFVSPRKASPSVTALGGRGFGILQPWGAEGSHFYTAHGGHGGLGARGFRF